jgi:hypothetical protein
MDPSAIASDVLASATIAAHPPRLGLHLTYELVETVYIVRRSPRTRDSIGIENVGVEPQRTELLLDLRDIDAPPVAINQLVELHKVRMDDVAPALRQTVKPVRTRVAPRFH